MPDQNLLLAATPPPHVLRQIADDFDEAARALAIGAAMINMRPGFPQVPSRQYRLRVRQALSLAGAAYAALHGIAVTVEAGP